MEPQTGIRISARAFVQSLVILCRMMMPLGQLPGVIHQTTVLAYCFGDGFSNSGEAKE